MAWFTNKSAHFVIFRTSHALPRSVDICEFNVTSSVIIDIFSTPLAGFSFHTTYYDVLEDAISKKKKKGRKILIISEMNGSKFDSVIYAYQLSIVFFG